MFVDRVEITFDAGHRLLGYNGKCASPHGHTFRAEVLVALEDLDDVGLALDFGRLKGHLKAWIDTYWDHGFLLNDTDTRLLEALRTVPESKLFLFSAVNPSAEVMARYLYTETQREFGTIVHRVRIWESSNQYAEYFPGATNDRACGPDDQRNEA